jgi:hypothetical protein
MLSGPGALNRVGAAVASSLSPASAALNLDFTLGTLDDRITFTRASTATYFDKDGVLQSAAAGEARFDYDPSTLAPRGLLIEEQRVNSIRNNTMQGAVAGTPGTLPTNWSVGAAAGLAYNVIGTGTESGVAYVDIQVVGTPTATAGTLFFEATGQAAALNAQVWSSSLWCKIVAGATTNITSINNNVTFRDSGGSGTQSARTAMTLSSTLTRFAQTGTATSASTAFVHSGLWFTVTVGSAIDITLRIGLPQLEQGGFATSVIPTTTTALTRNADVASMTGTNFSDWYSASEGTLFAQAQSFQTTGFLNSQAISDGTTSNEIRQATNSSAANPAFVVVAGGASQASIAVTLAATLPYKIASRYAVDDFRSAVNGTLSAADTSGTIPTVDRLTIGARGNNTLFLNGWIARLAYYSTKLGDSQLQALTA